MARAAGLGTLGRRLFTAFILVAMVSLLVLTVAALIGSSRGLAEGESAARQATAEAVAASVAQALSEAGDWDAADLAEAVAIGQTQGADVIVRDAAGAVIVSTGGGMGMGGMNGAGRGGVVADVLVDGALAGTVRLGFGSVATERGQAIAWTWILVAAVGSLAVAFLVARWTTGWLTAPIRRLSAVARAFAAGDRTARPAPEDVASDTELGDLARAFAAAAEDVERSDTVRRRVSADVAHELRTPLAVLQAGLEELRDGLVDADPDRIAALHDQSVRLGRIVQDLELLSAAESAGMGLHRERVDLGILAEEAVAAARVAVTAKGMTIACTAEPDVVVLGDPDRLHQVLGNLLSNAVRYCRPGDRIEVRVATVGESAVLTVADDGPGIAPEDLPYVFDRLWRGSAATTTDGSAGSGIGLAIVRELVLAHGGSVVAESDGESGTRLTVQFPMHSGS